MEENIPTFVAITDCTPEVAKGFLELAEGDVERAVALFYENPDLASNFGATSTSASTAGPPPVPAASTRPPRRNAGRQDASGVIHIDSDDDLDDDSDAYMQELSDDDDDVRQTAARAQEEEDAAMAKRLQEELYGAGGGGGGSAAQGGMDEDDVRAPIARTTETLVAPNPSWGPDDGGGLESAFLRQMRERRQAPGRPGGPFSQQIWADPDNGAPSAPENGTHARRLQDLFRPPYDLMARLSWDEARALGREDKKWLLVNLQDMNDFNCQALNRDIWKDQAVKDLVSDSFIFLQYDKDYPDAQEYITFYFPNQGHENPDNYPHVSIVDPRTGEQVKVWSGRPFPSAAEFHAELAEFLDRYSLAANSKNPVAKATVKKPQTVDVDRMTEDEMLEMALKNSLANEAGRSNSNPNVHDPDALTKTPGPETSAAGGGNQETEEAAAAAAAAEDSAFSRISSSDPHVEPENDPGSTTRIQFRHPEGRVIRRFNMQDPVRRLYEWLKAEPLPGKEGVEFELKKMPAGKDLIEGLEETVEEAGLKQGTVMIEFID